MNILLKLEKSRQFWIILTILVVFFFLRFPSLFEPSWYGDEGIYQTLGIGINDGRLLYRDIFDNKPPALYLLYSFVGSDLFSIRALSLIFGILSIICFYFLAKKIFNSENKEKITLLSTSIFAIIFGLPLIEGNIANAENFMLLPNIIAGFLVFKSSEIIDFNKKRLFLISAGLILGISFLFKIIALFDFAAFCVFLFFINYPGKLSDIFKKKILINELNNLFPFIIGFIIPISIATIFFILNNSLSYFLKAVLFNNIGYVNYGNQFIIPQGLLILKILILGALTLFIFYKRGIYEKSFIFVTLWIIFSVFNAFFSQRPYTHYVLITLPAFCLAIGLYLLNKNFSKPLGIITLSAFILIIFNFNFYIKTITYYPNFISFITGNKSVFDYQNYFDRNTPRDYELASFISLKSKKEDNIFIWGNNAQVYELTKKLPPGRYTVAYHITNYKDGYDNTSENLEMKKPKYIFIMPNVSIYPFSLGKYTQIISIKNVSVYERIY